MIIPIVPIMPVFISAFSSTAFIINALVVFPFVPVMPIVLSFSAGLPKYSALINANAFLVSSVFTTVTPSIFTSLLTTTAAAPCSTAFSIKLCPSKFAPIMHTNTQPFTIFLESYITSDISMSRLPCKSSYSALSSSFSNFIY